MSYVGIMLLVGMLSFQLSASTCGKEHRVEFIDYSKVDFSERPELLDHFRYLKGIFQVIRPVPPKGSSKPRVPRDEVNGEERIAGCTGSFLSKGRVALAYHCLWREKLSGVKKWILRKHIYSIENSRLVRTGYKDYKLEPKILELTHDLVVMQSNHDVIERHQFKVERKRPRKKCFTMHTIGYPAKYYAKPFLSFNGVYLGVERHFYKTNLPLDGGMSGGPQYFDQSKRQLGVNSTTQEYIPGKFLSTSPFFPLFEPTK